MLRRGEERAAARLAVLDSYWLRASDFLCGSGPTIADYLGSCYVAIAEWVSFDLTLYGNVLRWMSAMKVRPSWGEEPSGLECDEGVPAPRCLPSHC